MNRRERIAEKADIPSHSIEKNRKPCSCYICTQESKPEKVPSIVEE